MSSREFDLNVSKDVDLKIKDGKELNFSITFSGITDLNAYSAFTFKILDETGSFIISGNPSNPAIYLNPFTASVVGLTITFTCGIINANFIGASGVPGVIPLDGEFKYYPYSIIATSGGHDEVWFEGNLIIEGNKYLLP